MHCVELGAWNRPTDQWITALITASPCFN